MAEFTYTVEYIDQLEDENANDLLFHEKEFKYYDIMQLDPVFRILYELEIEFDIENQANTLTPLHRMVLMQNYKDVDNQNNLKDINRWDYTKRTPINYAILLNDITLIKSLLKHPEIKLNQKLDIELNAFKQGNFDIIVLLLNYMQDNTENFIITPTMLDSLCKYQNFTVLLYLLQQDKIQLNDDLLILSLSKYFKRTDLKLLQFIDNIPSKLNAKDFNKNCLHYCCEYNNPIFLNELCTDYNVEKLINQQDLNGNTPLHLTIVNNKITSILNPLESCIMCLLTTKNCNLTLKNKDGLTVKDLFKIETDKKTLMKMDAQIFQILGLRF